jgi:hypothetical protein
VTKARSFLNPIQSNPIQGVGRLRLVIGMVIEDKTAVKEKA